MEGTKRCLAQNWTQYKTTPCRGYEWYAAQNYCYRRYHLIADFIGGALFADKAYGSDEIVKQAAKQGMEVVIPPKSNRKDQRNYDKYLYKLRHLVENAFL